MTLGVAPHTGAGVYFEGWQAATERYVIVSSPKWIHKGDKNYRNVIEPYFGYPHEVEAAKRVGGKAFATIPDAEAFCEQEMYHGQPNATTAPTPQGTFSAAAMVNGCPVYIPLPEQ